MSVCKFGHTSPVSKFADVVPTSCMHCCTRVSTDDLKILMKERNGKCTNSGEQKHFPVKQSLSLECSLGHQWTSTWLNIFYKNKWCFICSKYKTENYVRALFEKYATPYKFPCVRPLWLNGLELDGFCEELSMAWELNGIQHYECLPYFHRTEGEFQLLQARDILKKQLCLERGVRLVVIPFTIKNFDSFVQSTMKQFM